jgi:hypothetical protein
MRQFGVIAAVAAALLTGGAAAATEKPAGPKPKKVCRTEQMPGRITPRRICRVVTPAAAPADPDKAGDGRGKPGRGN